MQDSDSSLLQQVERYFKQAIVDKAPVVASAALVSGLHMLRENPDIVKRWSSEVQDAVQSRNPMVQFLGGTPVSAQVRGQARDQQARVLADEGGTLDPLAQMMIVRCVARVIADSQAYADQERPFTTFWSPASGTRARW